MTGSVWIDIEAARKEKEEEKGDFPPPSFCVLCSGHITVVALPDWVTCACLATRPAAPMREADEVHVHVQ